ncbi:hypothetical protein BDY19DRAFT_1003912 [Irpex rosettiformis]|uniref:Uncharacterized protein n=1 Tax=Irpex rosettiformis TaxID=378272 RepID=A0ACB8TM09_9APHY|nr:hypothetical protein BDY19DRAFT_1003912 [Irpex rosettiformis]
MTSTVNVSAPPMEGLQNTVGVLYISTLMCVGLIGITTLQSWLYFLNHSDDGVATKLMLYMVGKVVVVWCAECIRCAFLAHASYYYMVSGWGNPNALLGPTWSTLPLMTNIGELIVQLYFAWRVWVFPFFSLIMVLNIPLDLDIFNSGALIVSSAFLEWWMQLSSLSSLANVTLAPRMHTWTALDLRVSAIMRYKETTKSSWNRIPSLNGRTHLRATRINQENKVFVSTDSSWRSALSKRTMAKTKRSQPSATAINISDSIQRPVESYQLGSLPSATRMSEAQVIDIKYCDV